MAFLIMNVERHPFRSMMRRPIAAVLEFSLDEATKLTKREGALYPSADEWELIDLFREIPEKNRREVIEIVRLTKKMVNGKKI